MSDAQINPDDSQGHLPRGEEWTGSAGIPGPDPAGHGFDALEGTGEPESSWLLEDDGFDLVVSSEPAETETVQALPTELDALQEQVAAPTWSEEEMLLGDDPMIGTSYVEPETASSAVTRALIPAGICMALSFGAIAVWSSFKQGVQVAPDEITADLGTEGPARPVSEPDVELVTPEIGNPVDLGRLSYQREGAIISADLADPAAARSTVDTPREPGELPPAPASTRTASAGLAPGEQPIESSRNGTEAAGATKIAGATGDEIIPATGPGARKEEVTDAPDIAAAPAAESTDTAAEAQSGEGSGLAAITQGDLPADEEEVPVGEDVAYEESAPESGGLPGDYILDVEPLDEETLRLLDDLQASGDDLALNWLGGESEQELAPADSSLASTAEPVEMAQAPIIEHARVAPLPGDEALGAFALRFPGPDFGPSWPEVPEILAEASTAQQPEMEAGPATAFLPFGSFGEDVVASLDVDPELVVAEFEITALEPVDVTAADGQEPREPGELSEGERGAAAEGLDGEGSLAAGGTAIADGFGDPWVPLEVVMDSLGCDASFGSSDQETITVDASGPFVSAAGEVSAGSFPSEDEGEFPAAVTVEIEVSAEEEFPAFDEGEESAGVTIETDAETLPIDEEDLDVTQGPDDDEAYPSPVTVEIAVSANEDVPTAAEDDELEGENAGTVGEGFAAAVFQECEGEAVANERLDAIFGPPVREIESGEPLLSDVFPSPDATEAREGAGAAEIAIAAGPADEGRGDAESSSVVTASEPTYGAAAAQDVPPVSEILPAPRPAEVTSVTGEPQLSVEPAAAPVAGTTERAAEVAGDAATTQEDVARLTPAVPGDVTASDVDRPTVEAPASLAQETAGDSVASASEEIEIEVLPGIAGATESPKYRSVVRRVSTGDIWPHSTVPKDKVGDATFVLTPNVGEVRVVFDGGETIDGRLHGVGQNRIVLDTRLGRLTLDGRRADRIDSFGRKSTRPSTGLVNTKGLDLVRVKAEGGIFQGHLLSRENGKVTLLLEQGMRITLESDDVKPAVGDRSVSRIRRDD